MALSYKTRGNCSPQGLSKVYVSCHPNDTAKAQTIADEILSEINCAVFYTEQPIADRDAHLRDLAEMNLITIPVTKVLLETPSTARDTELPFAEAHHIPILPLMQESGLNDVFTKTFGDLQYLDPNARDDTAIPYREKFSRYLKNILIKDELADQIRASFDAYIFLSYRKKDRAYAKELMRLIHENDFCRDVAIWYDEFLVPGENFNDSIAAFLDKSTVFALAVTPNLVNETNYVMTVEYPQALETGKTVLPVELVATDREKLKKSYREITDPIDAHDSESFAKALYTALHTAPLLQNDRDPAHRYLIGLAYLSGIDVEKNAERALSLITSAAEENCPEALEKLVMMYQNGDGVTRDYETAIDWQEKLVDLRRRQYEASHDPQIAFRYLDATAALGSYETVTGRFTRTKTAYIRLIDEAKRISEELPALAQWFTIFIALGYGNLGNAAELLGEMPFALDCHQNALVYAEKQMEINPMATPFFAVCHERIGNLLKTMGKTEDALPWYQKALALQEIPLGKASPAEHQKQLAHTYNSLGELFERQGNHTSATECYQKAFSIREMLAKTLGTNDDKLMFTIDCNDLARAKELTGEFDAALTYYQKSIAILESIVKEDDGILALSHLASTYSGIGALFIKLGRNEESHVYCRKAQDLSERLLKTSDAAELRFNEAASYSQLGQIAQSRGALDEALAHYQKALALYETLVEAHRTADSLFALFVSYTDVGAIYDQKGDLIQACAYAEKALTIAETLVKESDSQEATRALSQALFNMGDATRSLGELDAAEIFFRKSLALCEKEAKKMPTLDTLNDLAYAHFGIAELYCAKNEANAATLHGEEAYAIWQTLHKQYPAIDEYAVKLAEARALLDALS